jgi:hypothetical protein
MEDFEVEVVEEVESTPLGLPGLTFLPSITPALATSYRRLASLSSSQLIVESNSSSKYYP